MRESPLPVLLRTEDGRICQDYRYFYVMFTPGEVLEVRALAGPHPPGTEITGAEIDLPEGFRISLTGNKKGFLLKRLSCGEWRLAASVDGYETERNSAGRILRIRQRGRLEAGYVWGTGERFHRVSQRGSRSTGVVTEKFTRQGEKTYLPVPFFMTEAGFGCFCRSAFPVEMDFRGGFSLCRETDGATLSEDLWLFGSPAEILRQFVCRTGGAALPPEWAFGVWISANGWNCDAEVAAQLAALKEYDYPADVMVLEAWSDERTFYLWNGPEHWADPAATVRRIREAGLHLILWQIPVIKCEREGEPGKQLQADEREALERGLCVRRADGTPYRIPEGLWFSGSLLPDFTNPETMAWWFGKRKYLLDMGVEGFKTDGGEFLYDPAVRLHDGTPGAEAHNLYPGQYIAAYQEFMRQNGVRGVTFSRADCAGAQTRPIHWAGDQLSDWSELRSQLAAGITAGLSGVLFWGFDIGGFAGELPSAELYLRATALGCFSPVMQWHAEPRGGQFYATHAAGFNNDRSPWNLAEKLGDSRVLEIAVRFAKLRKRLQPYLVREAAHCASAGRPMMAHLCLDFPEEENARACGDQYMLGRDLLVCPVLREGRTGRRIWLPEGKWKHLFTGKEYAGNRFLRLSCPLDEMIVLERSGADVFA